MKFCNNCGNVLEETSKFCKVCGTPVAAEAAPVATSFEDAQTGVLAPEYEAPAAPVYEAPAAPAYEAPAYQAPAAPVYEAPAYQAPAAPVYEAPAYQAPAAPVYEAPAYQAPAAPVYEAPAYQAPAAPVYEAPAYQAPAAPTYEAPTYQPPVYQAPTYQPPVYNLNQQTYAPKEVSGGTKAKGFVGMGLGIGGLVFGGLCVLYFLIALADYYQAGAALVYGLFGLPLGIVGRIISGKSIDEGNTGTPASLGQKFGLAGLITSAVGLFLSFIVLLAGA